MQYAFAMYEKRPERGVFRENYARRFFDPFFFIAFLAFRFFAIDSVRNYDLL